MNACITRGTFVFTVLGECFIPLWNSNYVDMHVDVEIQLFRHVDMEKNMPTTALIKIQYKCIDLLHSSGKKWMQNYLSNSYMTEKKMISICL